MALRFDRGFWIVVLSMTLFRSLMEGDALVGCWRDQDVFRFFCAPQGLAMAIAWAGWLLLALPARARAAWRRRPRKG